MPHCSYEPGVKKTMQKHGINPGRCASNFWALCAGAGRKALGVASRTAFGPLTFLLADRWFQVKVLDSGSLKEFDEPYILLQETENLFYKMVQQVVTALIASQF
ncbi:UNVERIFIED_CONTAM: hypothetical protein K2H54_025410 [Gekko kuhli]